MAKFELKFIDFVNDDEFIKVQKYTQEDKSLISITGLHEGHDFCIWLDKSSAIKFAKTLRTEINKITESEGLNG